MKRNFIYLITCFALTFFALSAYSQPCPSGQVRVEIEIVPDNYPNETSWELRGSSGALLAQGDTSDASLCVDTSNCLTFTIFDTFGDGICCSYGQGSYSLFYDGNMIATGGNFQYDESVDFGGCGAGVSCSFPDTITVGSHTAPIRDTWYYFEPDSTGQYEIKTCNTNSCDTKIWVYDYCAGLVWDNTNQATIYYNDNDCGLQSRVTPNFIAGDGYWIRIGDNGANCLGAINWDLSYLGPIMGCMDTSACNYNPLATASGPCYFYPDTMCPPGPDLWVLESVLRNSLTLGSQANNDACMVAEGCMNGYGTRTILEFTTHIKNIGQADYYIGDPTAQPQQFTFDNCHNHYHYDGYAEYILYDTVGNATPIGFKNGFCVMDLECNGGGTAKYGCSDMGISAGCGDIYASGLSCQWVDITTINPGYYILAVKVNWDQAPDALGRMETDFSNNWAQACITIGQDPQTGQLTMTQDPNCQPYTDCLGVPYGNAVLDCEGVCNGPALHGDLNNNLQRELVDAQNYITYILQNPLQPTNCNDLNADGNLTVTDAAMLTSCLLYGGSHAHTGGGFHDHCNFPGGSVNINQTVTMKIDTANFNAGWLDVAMMNPDNHVVAYQFDLSGIVIDSVVNLADPNDYPVTPEWNDNTVIGISYEDSTITKSTGYQPLCRVYFSQTTANQVCLSQITDVVNDYYEPVLTVIEPSCAPVVLSRNAPLPIGDLKVYPNPFRNSTTISFANPDGEEFSLEILDMTGRIVRRMDGIRENRIVVEREGLGSGMYLFRLIGPRVGSGKLMMH